MTELYFLLALIGGIISCQAAELILDYRLYQLRRKQDKIGQMYWRVVSVGWMFAFMIKSFYGFPGTWQAAMIWAFPVVGGIIFTLAFYWLLMDSTFAKAIGEKLDFVGTTSKIDLRYRHVHLQYKALGMGFGAMLIFTRTIIMA